MIALIDNDAKTAAMQLQTAYEGASKLPDFDQNARLALQQRRAFASIRLGDGATAERLIRELIAAYTQTSGADSPNVLRVRPQPGAGLHDRREEPRSHRRSQPHLPGVRCAAGRGSRTDDAVAHHPRAVRRDTGALGRGPSATIWRSTNWPSRSRVRRRSSRSPRSLTPLWPSAARGTILRASRTRGERLRLPRKSLRPACRPDGRSRLHAGQLRYRSRETGGSLPAVGGNRHQSGGAVGRLPRLVRQRLPGASRDCLPARRTTRVPGRSWNPPRQSSPKQMPNRSRSTRWNASPPPWTNTRRGSEHGAEIMRLIRPERWLPVLFSVVSVPAKLTMSGGEQAGSRRASLRRRRRRIERRPCPWPSRSSRPG